MSKKELDQITIFEDLKNKKVKQKQAVLVLDLSIRQVKRKLKKYRAGGAQSLIHGNRGKPSNRQLDPLLVEQALSLIENNYPDFGPTFASEKLDENHQLLINHETLRQKMILKGLWFAKKRKATHREWRERKECIGELVQLDGSPHRWFEDKGPICTLLAFIDDASSQIMHLEFIQEEATILVMKATKRYLEQHGRPIELYMDRGKVFKVNLNNPDGEKITEYRRALEELNIKVTYARSPQAKGRVERLFGTLQDRLVKELRLAGISTMAEANAFIQHTYLEKHNQRFAVKPKESANLHRMIEGYDLNEIFTQREERVLTNDFTLRYHNRWFQLTGNQPTLVFPKDTIVVKRYLNNSIKLQLRKAQLKFREIPKLIEKTKPARITKVRKPWIPPADHPWRNRTLVISKK